MTSLDKVGQHFPEENQDLTIRLWQQYVQYVKCYHMFAPVEHVRILWHRLVSYCEDELSFLYNANDAEENEIHRSSMLFFFFAQRISVSMFFFPGPTWRKELESSVYILSVFQARLFHSTLSDHGSIPVSSSDMFKKTENNFHKAFFNATAPSAMEENVRYYCLSVAIRNDNFIPYSRNRSYSHDGLNIILGTSLLLKAEIDNIFKDCLSMSTSTAHWVKSFTCCLDALAWTMATMTVLYRNQIRVDYYESMLAFIGESLARVSRVLNSRQLHVVMVRINRYAVSFIVIYISLFSRR